MFFFYIKIFLDYKINDFVINIKKRTVNYRLSRYNKPIHFNMRKICLTNQYMRKSQGLNNDFIIFFYFTIFCMKY